MKNAKMMMVWLLSYISIASVSAAMITPALPNIEKTFELQPGLVEWVVSTFLIGYVIGQLVYGPLANSYGRLKALRWGLNINLLGLLICIFASTYPNYLLLLLGRVITGIGAAAGLTCTFMLINEWLPEEQRKTAMSYSILSFALGIGFAVLIGGIITQYAQWQWCFALLLFQGVLMRIGVRAFDETLTQPKLLNISSMLRDYSHALGSFRLITFSAIWGACSAVGYCYSAAAPQIAHDYLLLSASEYGYWNTLNIVGMLLGGLSAKILMQRLSVTMVIMLGYIGSGIGLLSLVIMSQLSPQSVIWFFSSTCLLYCCTSYLFAGGSYMASNSIDDKASASSMMSFINMLVATLSVVVMGYISANSFYAFLWILVGLLFVTLMMLAIFRVRNHE